MSSAACWAESAGGGLVAWPQTGARPGAPAQAVLAICWTPAGRGEATWTAKVAVAVAAVAAVPRRERRAAASGAVADGRTKAMLCGAPEELRAAPGLPAAATPARGPSARVQVAPAVPAGGVQDQPVVLWPAEKVVWAGTVSVRVTAAASWLPVLVTVSWKGRRAPAAAGGPV